MIPAPASGVNRLDGKMPEAQLRPREIVPRFVVMVLFHLLGSIP